MEHRQLGRTGVSVSKFCLGAMMFGAWGNPDHDESIRIIHAALDAGINFVDTADVYSAGRVGGDRRQGPRGGRRDDVVLATKFHGAMGDDPNRRGNSRRWIIRAVEDCLRRLNTDWIDLYQIHRPDPRTDIEETLRPLTDLVHRARSAISAPPPSPPSEIVEAQWVAERARPRALRHRTAAVLDPRPGIEARRAALVPAPRHGRHLLEPPRGRLALGPVAQGRRTSRTSARAGRLPERFDLSIPATSASSTP